MERKLVAFRTPRIVILIAAAAVSSAAAQGALPHPAPLPAVPRADGALAISVVYPEEGQVLTARDSSFVFGAVGSGRARLTVNGVDVPVAPNGAFLAWIALPQDSAGEVRLVARLGADSVVRTLHVKLPAVPGAAGTGAWLDAGSISPRGARWALPGEPVRVALAAAPGAEVTLRLPGGRVVPLVPDTGTSLSYSPFDRAPTRRAETVRARYFGVFPAESLGGPLPAVTARVSEARPDSARAAWIRVVWGADTARAMLPLRLALVDPAQPAVVLLDDDTARAGNTDGAVIGAPFADGTYYWFFRNGTVAAVSGRSGDQLRLALSATAVAWVGLDGVAATLPAGTPPPRTIVGLVRLFPQPAVVAARLRLSQRVPFRVDEDDHSVTLRLYGAQSDLDWVQYGGTDPLVPRITWAQPTTDEATVTFELSRRVFGWRAHWEGSDLVLELRRPPAVNRVRPLAGRVIAVDPGHPPDGATGQTGLREAEANLAVALVLRDLLTRAGARVVMTRTTDSAVGLYERTVMAESSSADALVSIHNNAFPDGVNPFENNGTSTYYFHPRSARLAMLTQRALVAQLGLRDLGVGRGDLALVRPTWMPAILTEGAFLMIPEQENALRTPSFQRRYALGILHGLEQFLREMAEER